MDVENTWSPLMAVFAILWRNGIRSSLTNSRPNSQSHVRGHYCISTIKNYKNCFPMLAPSFYKTHPSTTIPIHLTKAIALRTQLHPLYNFHISPLQADQPPQSTMAWRQVPEHVYWRDYNRNWMTNQEDDTDPTPQFMGMQEGWTIRGDDNPQNLVTSNRNYVSFVSLRHRDGCQAYDPSIPHYPEYGYEPDRPQFDPNFPVNEIIPMRMREQPDYGVYGDLYGYCGPYSHDWYAGRFR